MFFCFFKYIIFNKRYPARKTYFLHFGQRRVQNYILLFGFGLHINPELPEEETYLYIYLV